MMIKYAVKSTDKRILIGSRYRVCKWYEIFKITPLVGFYVSLEPGKTLDLFLTNRMIIGSSSHANDFRETRKLIDRAASNEARSTSLKSE